MLLSKPQALFAHKTIEDSRGSEGAGFTYLRLEVTNPSGRICRVSATCIPNGTIVVESFNPIENEFHDTLGAFAEAYGI